MKPASITPQFLSSFLSELSAEDRRNFFPLLANALDDFLFLCPEQYYLTKKPAASGNLSMETTLMWNRLIQKLSARLPVYRFPADEQWRDAVSELRGSLSSAAAYAVPSYSLRSRRSPACRQAMFRPAQLNFIRSHFLDHGAPLFLYGIGGVGKSELARAYADRYSGYYKNILFAEFSGSLQATFTDDARFPIDGLSFQRAGKHGEEGRFFRQKLDILSGLVNERTLIVIDNFDVLSDKRLEQFASLPCHLLFTTRTNPARFGFAGMHILPLQEIDDCTNLFYRYYTGPALTVSEQADVSEVLAGLNGHPLSIKQTALFLSRPGASPHLLLEAFYDVSNSPENIFLQVLQNFRIPLLSRRERTILRYLAVLPASEISIGDFLDYCCYAEDADIEKLMFRGLIDIEHDIIHIYPLIAQAVRETEKKFLKYLF